MAINYDVERLKGDLIRHEGLKYKPYKDTVGKLTIGIGHNLTDKGISPSVVDLMLREDIDEVLADPYVQGLVDGLDAVRTEVILNMAFNLGTPGLRKFRMFGLAVKSRHWPVAANEMLVSAWAGQVGRRAIELAERMRTGVIA